MVARFQAIWDGIKKQLLGRPLVMLTSVFLIALIWAFLNPQAFIRLWLTADQQAYLAFRDAEYEQAANLFENREWRAFSHYQNFNFEQAALTWEPEKRPEGVFARANALAHNQDYEGSAALYRRLLENYPESEAVKNNLKIVDPLAQEQTQSNKKTSKGSSLKMDDDQTSMREDEEEPPAIPQRLPTDEMWLEQVRANPAVFLQKKFMLEFENANRPITGQGDTTDE